MPLRRGAARLASLPAARRRWRRGSPPARRRRGVSAARARAPSDRRREAAPAGETPDTIRIGYQLIPNGDLIVQGPAAGWRRPCPAPRSSGRKFESGGDVNTAIVAGSLDIGLAGCSPVTRGLRRAAEHPVRGAVDLRRHRRQRGAGGAKASGVTDVAGLAGKKIATPFASTAHYSLLAALADAGVDAVHGRRSSTWSRRTSWPPGSAATSTPRTSGRRPWPSCARTARR